MIDNLSRSRVDILNYSYIRKIIDARPRQIFNYHLIINCLNMPKRIPRAPKNVVDKHGRTSPKVDFNALLPRVIEILHQHPWGVSLCRLFELLEQRY